MPQRPEIGALLEKGRAAFGRGDLRAAEGFLLEALGLEPRIAGARDMIARICLRQDRPAEAEHHARQAVALAGSQMAFHDTLIRAALRNGSGATLLAGYERTSDDGGSGEQYGMGALLHEMGREEEALVFLRRAQGFAPDSVPVLRRVAKVLIRLDKHVEAMEPINKLMAAGQDSADLHAMAGVCLLAARDFVQAAAAFGRALQRDEALKVANTGLSAALLGAGRADEARLVTSRYLERFPSLTRAAQRPEAIVLVLSHLTAGCFTRHYSGDNVFAHSNTIGQIPPRRVTFHHIYMNHPDLLPIIRSLGPIDAVFNDVANAEVAARTGVGAAVRTVIDALGLPVINAPEAVARTTREENALRIPAWLDIVFPRTLRYSLPGGDASAIAGLICKKLSFPLLVRRVDTHLDEHVHRADDEAGLRRALDYFTTIGAGEVYAIEYRAEPFRPAIYRKMRCVLIDGAFYPSNAVFSRNWNVHRLKDEMAFMMATPDLMEQEQVYLRDPAGYIGPENVARLEALAQFLELDFLGVDFNVAANGELVIFEANPAMHALQTLELGDFPYFADSCERFIAAFEDMLLRKAHEKGRRNRPAAP